MRQCPTCGNANNDFDVSCSFCGYQFDPAANNNNSSTADNSNFSANDNNNFSSNGNNYSAPYYQNNVPIQPKTNGYALASLILGIASVPLLCCCVGIITAILAIIFGFIARNKIAASNGYETGNGMALAGIITGFAVIGIAIILVIVSLASGSSSSNFWQEFNRSFQDQFQKQLEQQNQGQ